MQYKSICSHASIILTLPFTQVATVFRWTGASVVIDMSCTCASILTRISFTLHHNCTKSNVCGLQHHKYRIQKYLQNTYNFSLTFISTCVSTEAFRAGTSIISHTGTILTWLGTYNCN